MSCALKPGSLLLLLAGISLLGQKRPMSLEDIMSLQRVSDPQISPDRRSVVLVVTRAEIETNVQKSDLWAVNIRNDERVRLTWSPKKDCHPRWSPDGTSIAFLSDREGKAQLYILPSAGGGARRLTATQTPIEKFEWAPNGRAIAFLSAETPSAERKEGGSDEVVFDSNLRTTRLQLVHVESGKVEPLTRGSLHVVDFTWAPDGRRLALTAQPSPRPADLLQTELYLLDIGSEPRRLTSNQYVERAPRFSPDGGTLAFLSKHGKHIVGPEAIHLWTADGRTRLLNAGFPGSITDYDWSGDGRFLYFSAGLGVYRHLFRTDVEGRKLETVTQGDSADYSVSVRGTTLAFLRETTEAPPEVFLLNQGRAAHQLTAFNAQTTRLQLGRVATIHWKSKDGREVEGLVVYPVAYQTGKRYPLVVSIHGGPEDAFVHGFMASYLEFPHVLASLGYACFLPNFRGSSNYGEEFAVSNAGDAGGGDYEDIMTGVDHLIEQGIADPRRMAVRGWSYGGYLSAWAIGHTERFKVAVFGAGLSDAVSFYGQTDAPFFREYLHGGTPWTNTARWTERSPVFYLHNARTPALIFHGEKDERVPPAQSLESYAALKKQGVKVQLVLYPREPHMLGEPKHQLDKMRRELEWLSRNLN